MTNSRCVFSTVCLLFLVALASCSRTQVPVRLLQPAVTRSDSTILVKPKSIGPKFDKADTTTITWKGRQKMGDFTVFVSAAGLCAGESGTADTATNFYAVNSAPATNVTCTVTTADEDTDFQYDVVYELSDTHVITTEGPFNAHVGSCKSC